MCLDIMREKTYKNKLEKKKRGLIQIQDVGIRQW